MSDSPAPITEHLAELRKRITWIVAAWAACSVVSYGYAEQIFRFLLAPAYVALGTNHKLQAITPSEIFFTYMKCALLAGFILALPVIFWQVWAFVAPGLYANEKRAIIPFVFFSTLLFVSGAAFGYTQIFPVIFQFFSSFSNEFVESAWTMKEVFSVTTQLFLAFGVAFELPLFVFFLAMSGVVTPKQLIAGSRYAVLIIFVAAAVLTPSPDWVSQLLLAFPMLGLYYVGVAAAWIFSPERRARRIERRARKVA